MEIPSRGRVATALALVAGLGLAGAATAEVAAEARGASNNTIRRPSVITRPGSYTVANNIDATAGGTAIRIQASDVTLDLAGFTLWGPGGRQGVGVEIAGASNVTVRNGHLQHFGIGVVATAATNVTVEGLQIDGEDSGGAPPDVEIGVMLVETRGARIAGNTITDTFLGIFVRGEESGGNRISDNLVSAGANGELGICYNPAPGEPGGGPDGDLVYGNVVSGYRRSVAFSTDSTNNVLRGNTLAYRDLAVDEASPGANLVVDNDEVDLVP